MVGRVLPRHGPRGRPLNAIVRCHCPDMNSKQIQPLPPFDANGHKLAPGMSVKILTIPNWLIHDLPAEDVRRLREVEGTVREISEIDAHGYVWFERWFCLRPTEVAAEQ